MRSPEFIGRPAELAAVRQLVDAAAAGSGSALLVTGEAGIGKTRLLEEAARRAAAAGVLVLSGRAVQGGGTFRAVAEAVLGTLDRPDLAWSPALRPYRAALGRLLPSWAGTGSRPLDIDPTVLLGEGLLRLLTAVGTPGCLLRLEDLHWADDDTIALVEHLAGVVGAAPVLLAMSARDDGAGSVARRLAAVPLIRNVRLTRLNGPEVAALARACRPTLPITDAEADVLLIRSEGLPFLVEELLDALGEKVPPTLAALVGIRLDAMSSTDRQVLLAAAVLGEFEWRLLPAIALVSEQVVLQALRAAVDAGLLVADGPALRWPHALTRDAVLASAFPPERAVLAGRAARVLEQRAGPDDQLRAAELYLDAGEPERAATMLVALGRRAAGRGELRSALRLFERAADVGARGAEVTIERVTVLAMIGQVDDAIALGGSAVGQLVGAEHAELCLRLARAAIVGGRWSAAQGYVERAGRPEDPRSLVLRADAAFGAGRLQEAGVLADAAVEVAERAGDYQALCEALDIVARARLGHGLDGAAGAYRRAAQIGAEHGLTPWRVHAIAGLAMIEAMTGEDSTAPLLAARELAVDTGLLARVVSIELVLCDHLLTVQGPRAAAEVARGTADTVRPLPLPYLRATVDITLGGFLGAAGDEVAMSRLIGAALDRERGNAEHAAYAAMSRATVALLEHDLPLATGYADGAMDFFLAHEAAPPLPVFGLWALLRTATGDRDAQARARIGAHPSFVRPANRAALAYAEAIAHGRAGQPGAAADRFAEGDAILAGVHWWRRLLRLVPIEAAVNDGWGDPVPALLADLAVHETALANAPNSPTADRASIDDARLARTCRDLLRLAGRPTSAPGRGQARVPAALRVLGVTSREVDVLGLVVRGLTNAQVAERLFLSPRTVESHVASLLAKTGVSRRAELGPWARSRLQ